MPQNPTFSASLVQPFGTACVSTTGGSNPSGPQFPHLHNRYNVIVILSSQKTAVILYAVIPI